MSPLRTLLLAATALASVATAALADPTKVTLVLSHPNMAPGEEVFLYAVPKKLGYFAEEGLDVSVISASGGAQAAQVLQSGSAQFATTMAEGVLQMREKGASSKAFYELKRNNGFSVGIPADSPIKTLADLEGKTIGFPVAGGGTKMIVDESFRLAGLKPDYVQVVVGGGAPAAAAITHHQVDAVVLWDAAFGLVENLGVKLRYIELPVQDDLAGMSLTSTDDFIAKDPKVVAGFCRAVAKGLHYTLTNKEAAIKILFELFPNTVPANMAPAEALQKSVHVLDMWLDRAEKGLAFEDKTGKIDPARWQTAADKYKAIGMLTNADSKDAFTTDFFEKCNDFDSKAVEAQAKAAN